MDKVSLHYFDDLHVNRVNPYETYFLSRFHDYIFKLETSEIHGKPAEYFRKVSYSKPLGFQPISTGNSGAWQARGAELHEPLEISKRQERILNQTIAKTKTIFESKPKDAAPTPDPFGMPPKEITMVPVTNENRGGISQLFPISCLTHDLQYNQELRCQMSLASAEGAVNVELIMNNLALLKRAKSGNEKAWQELEARAHPPKVLFEIAMALGSEEFTKKLGKDHPGLKVHDILAKKSPRQLKNLHLLGNLPMTADNLWEIAMLGGKGAEGALERQRAQGPLPMAELAARASYHSGGDTPRLVATRWLALQLDVPKINPNPHPDTQVRKDLAASAYRHSAGFSIWTPTSIVLMEAGAGIKEGLVLTRPGHGVGLKRWIMSLDPEKCGLPDIVMLQEASMEDSWVKASFLETATKKDAVELQDVLDDHDTDALDVGF